MVMRVSFNDFPETITELQAMYFFRNHSTKIEEGGNVNQAMVASLTMGTITAPTLNVMKNVISEVYQPLLAYTNLGQRQDGRSEARARDGVTNEFISVVQKFTSQVNSTVQQVSSDARVNIPDVTLPEAGERPSDKLLMQLEDAVEDPENGWIAAIQRLIDQENRRPRPGKGPMAEIEYWRTRNASLATMYEQLRSEAVTSMLDVLRNEDAQFLQGFEVHLNDLKNLYTEAKDNVKFLTTLERHFKNVSMGSLSTITETLPPMMSALRMVWLISRNFNNDERMGQLLEMVAWEVGQAVMNNIKIPDVIMLHADEAVEAIETAKAALDKWSSAYYEERRKIEDTGREKRWDFHYVYQLFQNTNYMSERCADLLDIVRKKAYFNKAIGPDLRSVTGEGQGMEDILKRVESLTQPIDGISFNIFEKRFETSWEVQRNKFTENVRQIDLLLKIFIDSAYSKLKSAENALDLQIKLQTIEGHETIKNILKNKVPEILNQYNRELDLVVDLFDQGRNAPPRTKNQPPVAGAIQWSRALFWRVKKPMLRFNQHSLLDGEQGQAIRNKYIALGRAMRSFEQNLFSDFCDDSVKKVMDRLKMPILEWINEEAGEIGVSFSHDLTIIIQESKYLDRLGFEVPEIALNITLQEPKYLKYVGALKSMLVNYNDMMGSVKPAEKMLLQKDLDKLQISMQPGFKTLNWNSLSIEDFVVTCNRAIHEVTTAVTALEKNSNMIESSVKFIRNTVLIPQPPALGDSDTLPEMQEWFESVDQHLTSKTDECIQRYRSISKVLGKVEHALFGELSFKNENLKNYYHYWEERIFKAIVHMVVRALWRLKANLSPPRQKLGVAGQPLFNVTVSLINPEIIPMPNPAAIKQTCLRLWNNVLNVTKLFVRWMDGTCIECEPCKLGAGADGQEEEEFLYSYHLDVQHDAQVHKVYPMIDRLLNKTLKSSKIYIQSWWRYEFLWKLKPEKELDNFIKGKGETGPNVIDFDTKLLSYLKIGLEIKSRSTQKCIDFLRLNFEPLVEALLYPQPNIAQFCVKWWLEIFGTRLRISSQKALEQFDKRIHQLEVAIKNDDITEINELKAILETITAIIATTLDTEHECIQIQDCYYTLRQNCKEIDIPADELKLVDGLIDRWHVLVSEARHIDAELFATKKRFAKVTRKDSKGFIVEADAFYERYQVEGPGLDDLDMDEVCKRIAAFQADCDQKMKRRDELCLAERLFGMEQTVYAGLAKVEDDMKQLKRVSAYYGEVKEIMDEWAAGLWSELDLKVLEEGVEQMKDGMKTIKDLKDMSAYKQVHQKLKSFEETFPLLTMLKGDGLRPRHWSMLMEVTGIEFDMNPRTFTLDALFSMHLENFAEQIEEICTSAEREVAVEKGLQQIHTDWSGKEIEIMKYFKGPVERGWVLKPVDEMNQALDDAAVYLQTMSASKYAKAFGKDLAEWTQTISLIAECMEAWMNVQKKWQYLEAIFIGAEDIAMQLPDEAKRFEGIDEVFSEIMTKTKNDPKIVNCCTQERLDTLTETMDSLDACQKGLSEYLEAKRNAFARFYFVSDDDLLSILGSSNPENVQEHMPKMFDNVSNVEFGKGARQALGLNSGEKEQLLFTTPVSTENAIETWMTNLQTSMEETMHNNVKSGVFHYGSMGRVEWIFQQLGQVTLCGSQTWWSWETEDTFRKVKAGDKYGMKKFASKCQKQLNELVEQTTLNLEEKYGKLARDKVCTLIIIDVHARDIIDSFVIDSVLDPRDFEWESQLRFYWEREPDVMAIRQCTGEFRYGNEYMGNNGRLVVTGLTDRCYMTLTQALSFKLGGAPAGPAGTGKTETVKDLAKGLGLLCMVTNCGEGLDYKAMGAIFSGLCQIGAWGCFDEFNRIDAAVLSVVATQLTMIQRALIQGVTEMVFEGKQIVLKHSVGFFVTMNPGYAGRTELPDNVKSLFRPVTMIVPDLRQICEIMLMSQGFQGARVLSTKMTVLYKLSKEQLSKQHHYDFGMRALKSVLVMAGQLKRQFGELPEDIVLMRALRDMNLPKFIYEDVPLFMGLISDLFPGLECPRVRYESFNQACETDLTDNSFQLIDIQIDKCVQMYEVMATRHTTMIVGPTGGGKSVVLNTKAHAQTALKLNTKLYVVNPKAQTVVELYGFMDPDTREWTDGLLSNIFRDINRVAATTNRHDYIIFDGDVDAVWIENMNSVMDDNRLLTLPNGDRIRLQDHCKLVMEVADLQYASPATISRCGMVYVDPKDLGWQPFVWKWMNAQEPKFHESLKTLFDKYCSPLIDFVLEGKYHENEELKVGKRFKQVIPLTNLNMAKQLCTMLDAALAKDEDEDTKKKEEEEIPFPVIESLFISAVIWSIGSSIIPSERQRFDEYLKLLAGHMTQDTRSPGRVSATLLPCKEETLFEYMFVFQDQEWVPFTELVHPYEPPSDGAFHKIMVPTTDTVRSEWLLATVAGKVQKPILFVGESGTAKTVCVNTYLASQPSSALLNLTLNFSSKTTAADVQRTVEDNIDKRMKGVYGPPPGKSLAVFLDDLNMPKVDTYGTQQPIALLKLLIERGGCYDKTKDLSWFKVVALQYVAAMGPPGGGRNPVDPRFISLFNTFCVAFPDSNALNSIYSSMIKGHAVAFDAGVQGTVENITSATMELYNEIVLALPPTPSKFHYIFNLRDLSRIYEGLLLSTPDHFDSSAKMVRLWRNECLRVFFDRLNDEPDRKLVADKLNTIMTAKFPREGMDAARNPILFGDFSQLKYKLEGENDMDDDMPAVRLYQDMGTYEDILPVMEGALNDYNSKNQSMKMVLFDMALEHITRILRVLRMKRGNCMLVGVGGSGKQSNTRLAAHAAECGVFEIKLSRGYGEEEFREDLKELYNQVVLKPTVFLFTDGHVAEEGFLELVNNMLTSGMVPALFQEEDKAPLIQIIRNEAVKKGCEETATDLWNFFLGKCRDNMHIVLAMSPAGDSLRSRCRSFPGMVNNTTIDWFFPWPNEALLHVANVFLPSEFEGDERVAIVGHMVKVHASMFTFSANFLAQLKRFNYVTPKNYLDFIDTYCNGLKDNNLRIETAIKRLDGGLSRLLSTAKDVAALDLELKQQKVIVEQKSVECLAMLQEVQENTTIANARAAEAAQTEIDLQAKSVVIDKEKVEAEGELEKALPVLAQAEEALQCLNKNDITELKSFKNPKDEVLWVAQAVAIMKKRPEVTWASCQSMMGEGSFLDSLVNFDKSSLKDSMMKNIKGLLKNLEKSGVKEPDQLKRMSMAAAGLLKFVVAIVSYYEIAKVVEPKKRAVQEATRSLQKAMKDLKATQAEVKELERRLKELAVQLEQTQNEKARLEEQAAKMEAMLIAATKLMAGLESERVRWTDDMQGLYDSRDRLPGDVLLSSSFMSYTGAFTFDFREKMLYDDWLSDIVARKINMSENFKVTNFLTSDVEVGGWNAEGLPGDELSIQNGILTTRASRFALCIDPQLQAVTWLKNKLGDTLKVKTFNDDFQKFLEQCIQFGLPFLFESCVEYIDPIIDPVLNKNTTMDGSRKMIDLGGEVMEWNDDFGLYMTTKLANPHYGPEVAGKTVIINFSVTMDGLRDQLINKIVEHEEPAMEQQRLNLVSEVAMLKKQLKEMEDTLLRELAEATGNILENEELIRTLEVTKAAAGEATEKLAASGITQTSIEQVRQGYKPSAERGSILFFSMNGLGTINEMYQYSLTAFLVVFATSLRTSKPDKNLVHRLRFINHKLTRNVYKYTCTGLFQKHTLMYSFYLTLMILTAEGDVDHEELEFFLKGQVSLTKAEREKPYTWLSDQGWEDLVKLSSFDGEGKEVFNTLLHDVEQNEQVWKDWYDLDAPEGSDYPMGYSGDASVDDGADGRRIHVLSPFQKMLLLRCFRIDRISLGISEYVVQKMGKKYLEPPVLNYKKILNQSAPVTPVVFILSPGSDPGREVTKMSDEFGIRLKPTSMGQGQGPKAEKDLQVGVQRGQWILLMNAHLLWRWLHGKLEKFLEKIEEMKPSKDFRLWITTEPTDNFPLSILQMSLKVVTEPPNGLKLNMRQSYSKVEEEDLTSCPHKRFRPLVYVLGFFHAVVQERRKYGRIGWNVAYDFNESDFRISLSIMNTYLSKAFYRDGENGPIPWSTLKYLIGEAMYGGRVVDSFDRRGLVTYLEEFMGDFLFDKFNRFAFYQTKEDSYVVPENGHVDIYKTQVENQPRLNTPEVFGLHSNAEIGYFTTMSTDTLSQILSLQSGSGGGGGGASKDEVVAQIAADILAKLPIPFDTFRIRNEIGISATPAQVVLMQELDRFNILLFKMIDSLGTLQKALVGEVGMSAELEEVMNSLYGAVIPPSWMKKAPATRMRLANWMTHFQRRYKQYAKWIDQGEPKCMWLSGMHIPETYLAALVQQCCRTKGWALDRSTLYTKTTEMIEESEVKAKPEFGAYISGLYLEGAAWDGENMCLRKQDPKVLVVQLPITQIVPAEAAKVKLTNTLKTPVYTTSARRNAMGVGLVFEADMTTYDDISHWILQGVALVLNTD